MKKIHFLALFIGLSAFVKAQQKKSTMSGDLLLTEGLSYYKAQPAQRDIPRAIDLLGKSAAKGVAAAMAALGQLYDDSTVACNNTDSAIAWFSVAAAHGYRSAWFRLGQIYEKGRKNLQQDFGLSASYFYRGMAAGEKNCADRVAYYLYKGLGGRQDYDSAFTIFSHIAWGTHLPNAMYFLGLCYRNGYGTARNSDSALHWLSAAASLHEGQAPKELASKTPDNPLTPLQLPDPVRKLQQGNESAGLQPANAHSLAGSYAGYLIRYDWSNQHIISIVSLQAELRKDGSSVSGNWNEDGQVISLEATGTGGNLSFNNTGYSKKWHYTLHDPEPWQFKQAGLQLLQTKDSIYLTGDLQLYSPVRKEPSPPLYVYLARVATPGDKGPVQEHQQITVSPNPFKDRIQVRFTLNGQQQVTINLISMAGQVLSSQQMGEYAAGTYTEWINVPSSAAAGAYIVKVNTGIYSQNATIIKE